MLGAVPSEVIVETDRMLKEIAEDMGRGDTFHRATVGVYFGEQGKTVPDPFFGGEGPARRTRSRRTTSGSPRSAEPPFFPSRE
jgi:cholesterol oxidase